MLKGGAPMKYQVFSDMDGVLVNFEGGVLKYMNKRFQELKDQPDHPDHKLAQKLLPNGKGSMIAFGIKGGKEAGEAFINNVMLASHLANVGDTRTLVIHPASATHSQMDEATLKFAGLSQDMIRLSVGIEDIDDIKNDFEAGFRAARKPRLVSNQ